MESHFLGSISKPNQFVIDGGGVGDIVGLAVGTGGIVGVLEGVELTKFGVRVTNLGYEVDSLKLVGVTDAHATKKRLAVNKIACFTVPLIYAETSCLRLSCAVTRDDSNSFLRQPYCHIALLDVR
jgi:hypothetical protein